MALSYNKGDVVLVARRACSHDDNNETHNSQEDKNAKHDQYALCSIADVHTSTKLLRVVPQLSVTLVSSQAAAAASSTTRSSTSLSAKRTVIKCVSIVPHPSPQPTTTVQVADMMMMRGDTEEASTSLSCSSFDTMEVAAGEMEELIDRRRQLQDDVDGSKLRIEEINLYIQALGDHRKSKDNSKYPSSNTTTIAKDNNSNDVDVQEERRRLAEAVLRADREMLLCRAAMRTVKAQQWAQVRDAEENGTLPACARATLTAVATVLSTTMQELLHDNNNKNDQRIASIANAAGMSPAAMRVAEAYCKQYAAPHTISPEMSLSMPLNRWLHAVVHSFHAHKDATDFGLINDNNSNNRNTSSDRNDDATVQDEALHKELQEHTEYVQMALEELDALDEVINEMMRAQHSKTNGCGGVGGSVGKPKTREDGPLGMSEADIATDAEDHKHYSMVPLDQVLAVFPQTDMAPYLAMAATAASSTGGTTSIELSPRVSKRIIHVVEESSHQSGLRSNAAGGGGTLSKRAMELPTSIAAAHPKSLAGGGGGGGGVPPLSLQSLKTGSNTTTTSNNNRGGPTRRGRASRAALKGKVERAISAPRLASPRHGRPLLTSQTADNTPLEAPLSRPPRQPATEAVNRRRTTTTTPKAATGSADASMSLSLSSPTAEMAELRRQLKEAIHANPKYAEVHLIKEELKATASELHRVQDERDRLLTERRTLLPLLRGGRRRGPSSDVEAAEAPFDSDNNNSDQRDAYFAQDVIDDLEEQLASAHQRITELQQQQQQLHGGGGGVSCSINKEEISSRSAAKRSSSSSTALSDDTAGAASFLLMKNNNDIRLHAFNDVNTVNSADDVVGSESSAMRKELELQKRANRTLSETLNSTLHDQHVAEQAVAELKRELETMWSRLVDTETRLTEEQERSASTLLTGYHTTTNTAMQSCEQTPLRRDQRSSAAAPYTPFAPQHHNIQINNNNSNTNNNNTLSEYEKDEPYDIPRYSSADVVSSQVIVPPSPTPTAPASSSSLLPTFTHYQQQPVDQMTPIELRHAVGQLRREVDRLQSVELRLSTEMQAVKDKLKDERHRSRQARDVRLQMLTRLQEEVEVALTGHNTGLDTLPDVIERAREGSEVAQRRRSLSGGGTHFC